MSIYHDWAKRFFISDQQVDEALNTIAKLQVVKLLNIEHSKLPDLIDTDKLASILQYFKDNLENYPKILSYLPAFIEYAYDQDIPLYRTDEVIQYDENTQDKPIGINTIWVTDEKQVLRIYADYLEQAKPKFRP